MEPWTYYSIMKNAKDKRRHRLAMIMYAEESSVSEAARQFRTTRKTIRKWRDRYGVLGWNGLDDESQAPRSCPHKTPPDVEKEVLKLRKGIPWGPERILHQTGCLPCGIGAFKRIIRENGKQVRKRKKRSQKKNDLRAAKAGLAPMQEFQMDTKYLTDLAAYLPAMRQYGLPKFQHTIREVPTGATWLGFSDELSMDNSTRFIERFLIHLCACGLDVEQVRIQTDWGSEFDGASRSPKEGGFIRTIEGSGARHRPAPPGCPNANGDVESLHATIEDEFFNVNGFNSRMDFLQKATTFQHWYNFCRKNGSKGWRTPVTILEEKDPSIHPAILLLSPIIAEDWRDPDLHTSRIGDKARTSGVDTMYPSLTYEYRSLR
jgi:transposase InsO family protein